MSRCNGHREKFKTGKGQSVLSLHIMEKHPENFWDKLNNYQFGVIKTVLPRKLGRVEDCYIYISLVWFFCARQFALKVVV